MADGVGPSLWPLAAYLAIVVILTIGMVALSYFLGGRRRDRATGVPYESGMRPTDGSRQNLLADFYVLAVLFVIFDLESVFLYAWAVSLRQTGWAGLAGATAFIGVLLAALTYLWRDGALNWGPRATDLGGARDD